jgi:hypothetical protein
MKRKQYIIPSLETVDLRAIDAVMDRITGSASAPPHVGGAPRRRDSVF